MAGRQLRAAARALAAVLVAVVALGVAAAPATAADAVVVRKVDTSAHPTVKVSVLVTGRTPGLTEFALRENGRIVPRFDVVPISKTTTPVGIVLVIDTSGSMRGGKLEQAKTAAQQFVAQKLPNDQIAVVAFSSEPRVVVNFTADQALLSSAISSLAASGETALWDAVRTAAGILGEQAGLLPYVVVLSDGADTVSETRADEALGAATGARATVFSVGLVGGGEFDAEGLRQLAAATGGTYEETRDARELSRLYAGVQQVLQNQYELTYTSNATGPITIDILAGGARATASAQPHSVAGGAAVQPRVVEPPPVPAPLQGDRGRTIVLGLVVAAAAAGAVAIVVYAGREPALAEALRPYGAGGVEPPEPQREHGLVQTAVVRRAVEATARLAERSRVLEALERRLDQADLRLRPQEALFFFVAGVVIFTVGGLSVGGLFGAAIALVLTTLAPVAVLNQIADRRRRAFTRQLPDTLQLLGSSLRAGYSLLQGLEAVADEIEDPMGRELRRVVVEARLGRPPEDALEDTARRMASADFEWAVTAIRIQREVGGNLAELLSTVADTMVARERMRREVRALTAEGRFSAIILGALPVLIGVVIYVLNPGYIVVLFQNPLGKTMLLGSALLALAGFVWMKKIIEIEA